MSTKLNIAGSIEVEYKNETMTIEGSEFSLEEADTRNLGDGDFQYETLHIYFDPDKRFKILFQSTLFEGHATIYPATGEGSVRIVEDALEVVVS